MPTKTDDRELSEIRAELMNAREALNESFDKLEKLEKAAKDTDGVVEIPAARQLTTAVNALCNVPSHLARALRIFNAKSKGGQHGV